MLPQPVKELVEEAGRRIYEDLLRIMGREGFAACVFDEGCFRQMITLVIENLFYELFNIANAMVDTTAIARNMDTNILGVARVAQR